MFLAGIYLMDARQKHSGMTDTSRLAARTFIEKSEPPGGSSTGALNMLLS
jgi:hypothetical protein